MDSIKQYNDVTKTVALHFQFSIWSLRIINAVTYVLKKPLLQNFEGFYHLLLQKKIKVKKN